MLESTMENPFAVHVKEQYLNIHSKYGSRNVVELELLVKNKGEHFLGRLRNERKRDLVPYRDIFKPVKNDITEPIRRVLIEGGAGMGKTTLCISLFNDWVNGEIFTEYELLLFLPLCEKKVGSASSLFELIESLELKVNSQKLVSYVQDKRGGGLLVIADGWNHLSESECQVGSFFHSLLFGNTLSLASVIVTSRPTASAILHNDSSNFVDRFIEVCGFNRESIEDHVRSEFASAQPHTAADADGLLARIDCNPELHSVPISCTKLCQLWHTPKAFPTTMADLCTKIVLCILRHEKDFEIHSSENTSNSSLLEIINALPKDMQDSWWCLCKLALQTIDRNKLSLTQLGGSFQCGMMTFGLIEYDSTGVPDASLNFTHPTVKEYLAATCLVKHPSLDRTPIDMLDSICISGVAPPMFWTYLFKLAHQNVLEHALKIMSAHHVPKCIFCRCAYEAKNDVITSEVVKCLSTRNDSKTFVNFGNPRSVYDFDAMLYVVDNMKHYQCDGIEINCHKVLSTNCAISYNQIRTLVAMLLKQNTLNIRSLDLSNNSLQDETVADLFLQAASAFTSLEQLFVSNNSISTNGISAIISSTRRLTELDLSFNPLTKESLTILSDAIQSRTCTLEDFEILIMQGCLADDVDANITCLTTLIGNLMRYCVRFQKIDISGNYFKLGKPGNSDVHKMFKQVGGKFTLCFDDHYMTEDNVLLVAKIKEASMKTKTIDYTVAHGVFVGPGRSGKNSLMNRLLGKGPPGPNDKSPSTGVLESVVKAEVTVSELTNDIQWIQLDYDDEALELMMTAAKHNSESDSDSKANAMDGNSSSRQHFLQSIATTNEQHDSGESEIIIDCATTPDDSSTTPDDAEKVYVYEEAPLGEDPTRDDATALEIVNKPQPVPCTVKSIEAESLDVFKRAIKKHNMSAIRRRFETLWTLYLSNTGGQMEFQELLPLLVCGPSVFFITFPLNHDLDKPYDVCAEFEGRSPTRYRSSHTLLDEILQTVATIAALDSCGPYTLEAAKPKIFFVGTHKDQLSPESRSSDIQRIDKQLHERIKQTSLYDPILVGSIEFAIKDERLIFPVDNLDNDDTDFRNIRMRLHRIVKCDSKEFTISCPCPSLIFSLVLRAKHRTDQVLSYRDCFSIAERCGIRDLQEFHKALSFIHYRLGLIRYFSKDEFNEFVIIDPQILYNTITEVMNTTFQNQGILSLELINQENKLKVPLKWLLQVLEHLGIAASLDKHGKKCNYFFPAVLCHAQHRESPTPTESAGRLPPPILIAFESGFCPRGIAVRLIVHLLTNEKWELQPEGVFRNEICLSAGPCDIILKISCTHLELVFDPEWEISDLKDSKLKGYCADVFSQLREAMQIVINNYRNCSYFFALYCERSACKDRHPHPAKIKENSKTMWLSCTITNKRANFPRNWFGGILSMNEVISDKHIGRIADTMPEWEGSNADALDLTPTDVNAIKTEYSKKLKLQNRGALMRWREKCGANATYNNLIGVFEYADNNTLADFVKNLEPEVRMEFQKSFGGNTCSQTSHLPPEYPKVECKTIYVLKEAEPCLDSTHDSEDASMSASEKSHLMETEESKCPANDQNLQLYATNPVRDSCDSAVVDTADQQVKDTELRSDMEQPVQTKNSTSNVQYDSTKPGMESQSDSEHSTPSSEESRDSGTSILVISDKSVQGKFSQNTSSTMHPEEGRSVDDVEHTTKGTEQHIQLQPGDVSGHCIEPENKICSDRSQTGSRPVASGTASDVSHALTTSVDDRNQVEDKITKQTDSETLKLTQRHFQEAMKYGKASTSIMKVVLFGLPESGKTCTKHIILDEEPPQEYTSTPLALRPVTTHYVDITPGQWRKLSRRERDEIVATACQCYSSRRVEVKPLLDVVPSEEMPEEGRPTEPDTPSMRDPVEEPNVADMATLPHAAPVPTSGRAAPIRNAPKPKREAAAVLYPSLQTQQNLLDCLDKIQVKDRVFKIKRVQISDCGSQSQFHEILPVFIRGTTLFLYVFKLNEALSSKPMIKYYDKGKPICDDYQGTETYEQILEHCLRVVRSQKATGEKPPQIMIIGTHKDKEQECESETRETKNKKLAKLLLPEFKSEVKYYRQLPTEVIFPINARNPGDEEKKIAAEIRRLIEIDCEAKAVDIPLQWLGLESLLEDLTKACGRDVILKSELFAAARSQLYIKDESALDAALDFLHEHNLVFYYPEILPDVVFANAQVLLNKVTELVRAAHKGTTSYTLQGELWQRFCNYALVSEVFLAQKEFQKYYIPDVFNHKHLMELFIKLLIFAPLSATEVFVPVILKKLTKQELSEHRVTTMSPCASLVLTFRIPSHGGPLLGVFCATVGALLSEDNVDPCRWKLTMDSEDEITPSCLKRNCVQFSIEGHPGTVTIIDSFQYIEVHIHLSPQGAAASIDDLPAFCKMIRRSLFQALRKATLALNYNYSPPVIGFGCCCGDPTFHLASISANKKLWMCKKGVYSNRLNKSQLMWLEDNEKVDEVVSPVASIPVLHELDLIASREKEVRVMKIVTPHWERFSYRLHLRRETISTIKKDNPQREDDACQAMFNMWLNGEGRKPVSWGTLITALNEAELSEHAQDLGDIITQK